MSACSGLKLYEIGASYSRSKPLCLKLQDNCPLPAAGEFLKNGTFCFRSMHFLYENTTPLQNKMGQHILSTGGINY